MRFTRQPRAAEAASHEGRASPAPRPPRPAAGWPATRLEVAAPMRPTTKVGGPVITVTARRRSAPPPARGPSAPSAPTWPMAAGRSTPFTGPRRGPGVRGEDHVGGGPVRGPGPSTSPSRPVPLGVEHRLGSAGGPRGEDDDGQVAGRAADSPAARPPAPRATPRRGLCPATSRAPGNPAAGSPSPARTGAGKWRHDASTSDGPMTRLSGTATAPSRQQARNRQTAARPLGSWKATASPRRTPAGAAGRPARRSPRPARRRRADVPRRPPCGCRPAGAQDKRASSEPTLPGAAGPQVVAPSGGGGWAGAAATSGPAGRSVVSAAPRRRGRR